MPNLKRTGVRVVRKSAYLSSKVLGRGARLAARVEDKTTRIITGKDFSVALESSIPVEKALFNGIHYNIAPLNPALPAVGRGGKVTLLIPSLNKNSFFGGTATALIIAGKLADRLQLGLRIIETLAPGGKAGLGDFFKDNDIALHGEVELIDVSARTYDRYGYLDLHPDDILMASAWWDARLLAQLPLTRPFIYLIQDYEPIFYSNSDEYVLAEATYHGTNFIPLCNTELMYDCMVAKGYDYITKKALWFEPAVSKQSFGLSTENSAKRRLFLYGRPSVARNLFYCAIDALNQAFADGKLHPNDWELFMAGQDKLPDITLSSGAVITNLGKMSMPDYNQFIRSIDLALSPMMAPHPNYPTLEFASVGAAVVTTRYETKQDLSRYSPNIVMADTSVASLRDAILTAADISYQQRMDNLAQTHVNDSWDTALDATLNKVIKQLKLSARKSNAA